MVDFHRKRTDLDLVCHRTSPGLFHTTALVKKAQQQLYFLMSLDKINLSQ